MTAALDSLLVLMILANLLLLGSSRLVACIRICAVQGFMVGLLPIVLSGAGLTARLASLAVTIAAMKGFVFPYLLSKSMRDSNTSREARPFLGYATSVIVGVMALFASFWLDTRLHLPMEIASDLAVPVAFSMMITGVFLIIARRTAVNQVIGYLVMENGIYTFGLIIVRDIPLLVEIGVLMDLFVAVFVMGIAIYRINREFDHIDSDQLSSLKG